MSHMLKKSVARGLRNRGFSYGDIADTIGQSISKGSLSGWCRGVAMGKYELAALQKRTREKLGAARANSVRLRSSRRLDWLEGLRQKNAAMTGLLSNPVVAKMVLGALFLGEGSKGKYLSRLTFANANPAIIKLYLDLLRDSFPLIEEKFRCTVMCRADQNIQELEAYWSAVTGIPKAQFYATRVDARSTGQPTLKAEYKGVCRLDYFSTLVFNEVAQIGNLLTEGR